jgi:hypothetical protein
VWFVPTRGRPERLQKFLDACVETKMSMPGLIVIDGSDQDSGDYSKVQIPSNWAIRRANDRAEVCGRMEEYFKENQQAKFYSIINDDVVPETPYWDVILAESAGDWNISYPYDTISVDKECPPEIPWRSIATQFVVGGKLCRGVGSLSLGFIHTMVDRAWMNIGDALGNLYFHEKIRLRHEHWSSGFVKRDKTYERRFSGINTISFDKLRYQQWKDKELNVLVERLKGVIPNEHQ